MSTENLELAEGWRPEPGAVLVGTVVGVDAAWSDYLSGYYPLVTIDPDDGGGAIAVHCFHDVLRSRMMDLQPRAGERIGIKYHGQVKSQDGKRTISRYVVRIDGRDSGANVWERMADSRRGASTSTRTAEPESVQDEIPF